MIWENLIKDNCPHCGRKMEDRDGEMRCTRCSFHMTYDRYQSVKRVRTRSTPVSQMKWQNLLRGHCPICNKMMMDVTGRYLISRCIDQECPFKIRDDDLSKIMSDENHPINKYKDDAFL